MNKLLSTSRGRAGAGLAALTLAAGWFALMPSAHQSTVRWLDDVCSTIARPMFSSIPAAPGAAARPATKPRILSCEPLPDVPGKSVTAMVVDFDPLAFSPAHRHPGSVTAVVIEGTIRSQMGGGPVVDYKAGESWFEPPRILHVFAENPDAAKPAKLMAYFVTDENCGPLVIPEPQ